jgi:integrase
VAKYEGTTYDLTSSFVKDVPLAQAGQRLYWDKHHKGFGLLVGRRSKSFVVQREVGGKTRRVTLGRYGAQGLTVKAALALATTKRAELTLNLHTPPKRGTVTLADAWANYNKYLITQKRSLATIKNYQYLLTKYLADWMTAPLVKLERADVRERHDQIAAQIAAGTHSRSGKPLAKRSGATTANLVMKIFRAVYQKATVENEYLKLKPTASVNWNPPVKSRQPIPDKDLPTWYTAVTALPNKVQSDALLFLLFSGMRKMSVLAMRWEDVDLPARRLHIPLPKGGAARAFDLPLSDALVEILNRRKAEHPLYATDARCAPWVFPSLAGRTGHISAIQVPVPDVPYVLHELRDTFASVARRHAKLNHYHVATILNHKQPGSNITDRYAASGDEDLLEELRVPMQRVADALTALTQPDAPSGKVVPMRRQA